MEMLNPLELKKHIMHHEQRVARTFAPPFVVASELTREDYRDIYRLTSVVKLSMYVEIAGQLYHDDPAQALRVVDDRIVAEFKHVVYGEVKERLHKVRRLIHEQIPLTSSYELIDQLNKLEEMLR